MHLPAVKPGQQLKQQLELPVVLEPPPLERE
jgi:hypothetical protein